MEQPPSDRSIIPAQETRRELIVQKSRFIATAAAVFSVDEAKSLINRIRQEFSDASHNVPGYIVGHGASVIMHCSDDGEPSGTAGRPILGVMKGSGLGNVGLVVTRYFGGIKLGTGGLVHAYSDAARAVLEATPRAQRLKVHNVIISIPYPFFESTKLLIYTHRGKILEETFSTDVMISAQFIVQYFNQFNEELIDLTHGNSTAYIIDTTQATLPLD